MDSWEYKVIVQETSGLMSKSVSTDEASDELTTLGDQGWELVGVAPLTGGSYMTKGIVCYLRRRST